MDNGDRDCREDNSKRRVAWHVKGTFDSPPPEARQEDPPEYDLRTGSMEQAFRFDGYSGICFVFYWHDDVEVWFVTSATI